MFRDPRDVLKGRVDAKVNQKTFAAKRKAMGAAQGAASGAAKKAKGGADPAAAQAKKKKKMGWWPFGGKEGGAEGAAACPGCTAEIDPSWAACPYCGADLGGPPAEVPVAAVPSAPAVPAGPGPGGMVPVNKTVAIDLEALKGPQRSVVGWIVVMQGSQKGMDFRLFEGTNSIGAAADNDIVVTDEYLSSKHAAIRFEDGRYELRDHESTNGSFVNEKKIDREELIDNDSVRFGRTEFRFKALY